MKVKIGGRRWKSLDDARNNAKMIFEEPDYRTEPLSGFAYRLARDFMDLHVNRDWFLAEGAVRRLIVEEEFYRPVIAAYVGPNKKRFWFSFANCKLTMPTDHSRIVRLMRKAISDQISDYRTKRMESFGDSLPTCCLCNCPIESPDLIHVHHHLISFRDLVDQFTRSVGPICIDDQNNDNWLSGWQQFHREKAILALTHQGCNVSFGCGEKGNNENGD